MGSISFSHYYGEMTSVISPGPVPEDFTLNTPVGIAIDSYHNVWVCDTGNNRVVIFDSTLKNIVAVLYGAKNKNETKEKKFLMPFHVCAHPEENKMYLTDMGAARVVVFSYDPKKKGYAACSFTFGCQGDGINDHKKIAPLQDPNGVALIKEASGHYVIYVTDEFYHTEKDPLVNRCVKYDAKGKAVSEFQYIEDSQGVIKPLKWPQGLSSDSNGNLYLANTGFYEVLKIPGLQKKDSTKVGADKNNLLSVDEGKVFLHSFGEPNGAGFSNIIRGVDVVGDLVFVADQVANKVSVYHADSGNLMYMIEKMIPEMSAVHPYQGSISNWMYAQCEDFSLLGPYALCAGEEAGIYFITEPTLSRVVKVKIPKLEKPVMSFAGQQLVPELAEIELLAGVGKRRNNTDQTTSQFNMITAVSGLKSNHTERTGDRQEPGLPDYLRFNPVQMMWSGISETLNAHYKMIYDLWFEPFVEKNIHNSEGTLFNIDSGNWTIKGFQEKNNSYSQQKGDLQGMYMPGDLGVAAYYPDRPLFGQICPNTPLFFVTNFETGMISMYQFDILGKLTNYGLPFGMKGNFDFCLNGPQGLAVNDFGEIYIASSIDHKVSKWRLLPTGQVIFIKTFTTDDPDSFMPTDIAIDKQGRVFVCDQEGNKIWAFTADGEVLWHFGKAGYSDGTDKDAENFMLPTSICIDDDYLLVNDLVGRAIKIYKIEEETLKYYASKLLFKDYPGEGGVWMPYLMYADQGKLYVPDCAYNIVNVYHYN